ncbi:fimbrillin family protein [Segatella oris]|uniref:fimbrillin family protein n=1 Tax=Segatella oris TaxID=28135 RepID=UPI0028F01CFE|nr:fimbrillin family protein [Segatella oris]
MKTIKNLAMLAVAALATAACSNDENLVTPTDHFPADGIIRVAADVTDPQTRAGMETNNLTMFQLRVQNPVNDTYSYNAQMKKDGDQWVSYKNDGSEKMMMLWQNKTQKVNVAAVCIPGVTLTDDNWKATGATPVNIMVEADQSKADKLNKSDLLAMKNHEFNPATELTTGGKMKVELKHRLAKLNLTVKLGTDFNLNGIGTTNNPITEVNVNGTNTKAAWTLITDEFNGLSEKKSVKPLQTSYTAGNADKQNAVAKYECILLPQTINANGFAVKIVIGGKLYTWKSGDKVTLTSNTQYNLTLTVGKDIVVIGSFTATPWIDGDTQNIETK